ncbi:SDR family oxidoreductase [Proteus mirabilis]|nr:SDR family oxidoreductase [Proteus mirabilis]
MKRITIVGLGWLGLPLANALREAGYQVKGTKTTEDGVEAARMSGVDCCLMNLTPAIECDRDDFDYLMETDVLIITLPPSAAGGGYDYVEGIQTLVDSAMSRHVTRVIYISSTSVYGNQSGVITEEVDIRPETQSAKMIAEVENWLHRLPLTTVDILRLAGLVGPGRHAGRFLSGKKQVKDAHQSVNLVHLDDVIFAIEQLLAQNEGGRLYNLCAPIHPKKKDFYSRVAAQLELTPPEFALEDKPPAREIDGQEICRDLGFHYHYPDPDKMPMS